MPTVYKSLFPDPPEVDVSTNATQFFHGRPDQADWSDYTLYIEGDTGAQIGYDALWERVKDARTAFAQVIPVSESGETEIVGIMGDNSIDYATILLALLGIAVPFALISGYSTKFELSHVMKLSGPTSMFVNPRHLPTVLSVAKDIGLPSDRVFVFGGRVRGRQSLDGMVERVRKASPPSVGIRTVSKDTLAYLVFSSGTTGLPKAVMITHQNLIFSMLQHMTITKVSAEVYQPPPPRRPEGIPATLAFLPMYHSYGLHAHVFRVFNVPATHVILKKWSVEHALKLIRKYQISFLTLVPSAIHQLVTHPATKSADMSSLQFLWSGAAYLPPELGDKLLGMLPDREARMSGGYGLSETTIAALALPTPGLFLDELKPAEKVPTGILIPGQEARVVREDGSDASIGEVGEFWLKGRNISPGYFRNPDATRDTFVEGGQWLRSGDMFWTDGQNFYFADRGKDTLKVSGTQVSPVEIETVLRAYPEGLVEDVSVAGVSGGRTSDELVPRAWVVLSPAGKKLKKIEARSKLDEWTREQLSRVKWLRGGIEFVPEIPKSPTGKVLRRVLQDKYERKKRPVSKSKL